MNSEALSELETLSPDETERLKHLEAIVARGLSKVTETAVALMEIRDSRLYRATHRTWSAYVRDKWQMGYARAHQLMASVAILNDLADCEVQPRTVRSIHPLAAANPADRAEIWNLSVEQSGGNVPSAETVQAVRDGLGARVDHSGRKTDTYVPKSVEVPGPVDISPEDWIAAGQQLVRAQRESEFELGAWFELGEQKFGAADKLLDEVAWTGPSKHELHRRAAVARQFPESDRPLELPFRLVEKAVVSGNASLVVSGASEEKIRKTLESEGSAKRAVAIQAGVGQELEQSELTEDLSRYWPRIYGGILNHYGTQHEAKIIAFIEEALHDRKFALRGQ